MKFAGFHLIPYWFGSGTTAPPGKIDQKSEFSKIKNAKKSFFGSKSWSMSLDALERASSELSRTSPTFKIRPELVISQLQT